MSQSSGLICERTERVRRYVLDELGFDVVGFAPVERLQEEGVRLEEWLERGMHGSMAWLERNHERRIDPGEIVQGARTVIVVGRNYYTPEEHSEDPSHLKVSRYAWGRDYHRVMPKMLKRLHRFLLEDHPEVSNRWYVDTGPVMEKAWAVRAGLGWMGKHSNVITRSHGSWLFLGTFITTLEFEYGEPIADFCGSCTACLDACPTDAIVQPQVVDARRCISYLTIEQPADQPISGELSEKMEGWAFGCDICQDVCPWNKFQQVTDEDDFRPRPGRLDLTAERIMRMTAEEFEEVFRGSPIMRPGLEGMKRNVLAPLPD